MVHVTSLNGVKENGVVPFLGRHGQCLGLKKTTLVPIAKNLWNPPMNWERWLVVLDGMRTSSHAFLSTTRRLGKTLSLSQPGLGRIGTAPGRPVPSHTWSLHGATLLTSTGSHASSHCGVGPGGRTLWPPRCLKWVRSDIFWLITYFWLLFRI